jgi:alkyl sulfatase BDS1-like metallo-beta-lactamase superfamily hydrolase
VKILTKQVGFKEMLTSPDLQVSGSMLDLVRFFSLLDTPGEVFPIVTVKS